MKFNILQYYDNLLKMFDEYTRNIVYYVYYSRIFGYFMEQFHILFLQNQMSNDQNT